MRPASLVPLLTLFVGACSDYNLVRDQDPLVGEDDDEDDGAVDGPQPDIDVEPAELSFGWTLVDCPADAEVVTVTNLGDADLDVTDILLEGAGSGAFTHDGVPRVLAPGASFTFEVGFTAGAIQDYDIDVVIASNDPDEAEVAVPTIGRGGETATNEEIFTQPAVGSVDVLWVVDNSGSMSDVIQHLGDRFQSFLTAFDSTGIDYRIGVTSTDMDGGANGRLVGPQPWIDDTDPDPVSLFTQATDLGSSGSATEKGLDAAYAALTPPLTNGDNAGFLREDAVLAVVVISDEDDSSTIGVNDFSTWMDGLKADPDRTSFSAVVGDWNGGVFDTGCSSTGTFPPVTAAPGERYIEVQRNTGGTFQSICDDDFDEVLSYLGYGASGLAFDFPLEQRPSSIAGIQVQVDGTTIPRHPVRGWFYDSTSNTVRFSRQAVPGPESTIVITYPVDGDC